MAAPALLSFDIRPPLAANVFTFVGLPPGLPAALFLLTALAFCDFVIRVAFASGTHFGYALLLPFDLPQG